MSADALTFEPIGAIAARIVERIHPAPAGVVTLPITSRAQWLDARRRDVTASVAGALFGVHEYQTAYGLFCEKSGLVESRPDDAPVVTADSITLPPTLRGTLLEAPALELLGKLRPAWRIQSANDLYWRMPAHRIGATPDAFAIDPDRPGRGVIQIKTASDLTFRAKWRDEDGEVHAPTWIGLQAVCEARLTGASWACVALLVSGATTSLHVIDVPLHEGVWNRLVAEVAEFWRRVETGRAYDPDYGRDAALIHAIHAQDDGETLDLSGDNRIAAIVAEREELKATEKAGEDASKMRRILDAEIIARLGAAAHGRLGDGRIITAKTVRRSGYTVKPSTYRQVKIKEIAR